MVKEGSILYGQRRIKTSDDFVELIRSFLEGQDREVFIVCCLDVKNQPTCINVLSVGTLNSSFVHPREVFKPAILSNSAAIVVTHNHPSGDVTESKEDIIVTKRLKEAEKKIY